MGYYVISCDYLPNNPGHRYAHEYYNISTTDKEAVYKLAKDIQVDGIVAYASDPAAPTAAYVCEKLGLPTSPYSSVEILSRKDLFRQYLSEHNFNVPTHSAVVHTKKLWIIFIKSIFPQWLNPLILQEVKGSIN